MINKNKINLTGILILYSVILIFFEIVLFPTDNSYFWCVSFNYFEDISAYLPIHCDEGPYFEASQSIDYFFSENNPYQKRPLYVLTISILRKLLNLITFGSISNYLIFRISILLVQYLIVIMIAFNFIKLLKIKKFDFITLLSVFSLIAIPNIRWNLLYPSHGNLTLLLLLITLVKLNDDESSFKSDFYFFSMLGFGALFHRSSIVYGLIVIFLNKLKLKSFENKKLFVNLISLLVPSILYECFFYITNFTSYDWNKEIYGQFYWLIDILRGVQNNYHDMSCQQISTFYKCNFEVSLNFISYFAIGFLFLSILIYINSKLLSDSDIRNLLLISMMVYIFWGLQGLYPNFRFINYSLGYFIFLFLIFTNYKYFKSITLGISIIIYQLSILYLEPYSITYFKPNILTYISLLIFIIFFVQQKSLNKS